MQNTAQTLTFPQAIALALDHHRAGRLPEAEAIYRQILDVEPEHFDSLHLLGVLAQQVGKNRQAIELIEKAIQVNAAQPAAYNNLGEAYRSAGRMKEAQDCFQKALALQPDYADAHNNLGLVFKSQGKTEEAAASCRKAIALKPDYADALYNLGNAIKNQGKIDEALSCYQKALTLRPDYADAHAGHGLLLMELGRYDAAMNSLLQALRINATPHAKEIFFQAVPHVSFTQDNPGIRQVLIRALTEPWGRSASIAKACIRFIRLNGATDACIQRAVHAWPARLSWQDLFGAEGLASVANNPLLLCLLETTTACDLEMERFLTQARYALLESALENGGANESALPFAAALSQQCFINEFIFTFTDEEENRAKQLRKKLETALAADAPVPALWVAAVGAYFPLTELAGGEALLRRSWPASIENLLTRQMREPLEEKRMRASMPALTGIEDDVSLMVRQQYEENPYPRWLKAPVLREPVTLNAYLREQFPFAPFKPLEEKDNLDILIAGCGTGQQSVDSAKAFTGAKLLAIDLSLSSLCYAQRKTRELGIENIEYAHADLMKLGEIDRTFDVVEVGGVLVCLADPTAGWRVLLSKLRPGGFMRLGLYSEAARQSVVAARDFIAAGKYASTPSDIRRCRQDIIAKMDSDADLKEVVYARDFYSMSECRDFIFHVKEHRFTLPQIKDTLKELKLDLVGFNLPPLSRKKYRERFPDDVAMTNLDNWDVFEAENPNTFSAMYQFWVQKPA